MGQFTSTRIFRVRTGFNTQAEKATMPEPADHHRRVFNRKLRDLATGTQRTYRSCWRLFDQWRGTREVCDEVLADYVAHLFDKKGRAPGSLKVAVRAVGFRHRWTGRGKITPDEWIETFSELKRAAREGFRRGNGRAPHLRIDQVERTIQAAESSGTIYGTRDAAMIACQFYACLRISEVVGLEVQDLQVMDDGSGRLFIAKSKTDQFGEGQSRAISKAGVDRILAWMERGQIVSGPIFRSMKKVGFDIQEILVKDRAIAKNSAAGIVTKRAAAVGLKGVTSHSLRRSMAGYLRSQGLRTVDIQEAGGWSSADMVLRYTARERGSESALVTAVPKDVHLKKARRLRAVV